MMVCSKMGDRYAIVTLSIDDGLTLYDKTTNEVKRISFRFSDRGDIGNEYICASNQKELEPIYAELTAYGLGETMLAMQNLAQA